MSALAVLSASFFGQPSEYLCSRYLMGKAAEHLEDAPTAPVRLDELHRALSLPHPPAVGGTPLASLASPDAHLIPRMREGSSVVPSGIFTRTW